MHYAVLDEFHYQNRPKRKPADNGYIMAVQELDQLLTYRSQAIEERMLDQEILESLLSYLTPKEKDLVRLKADGYTYNEIADFFAINVMEVRRHFTSFRNRLMNSHISKRDAA